MGRNSERDLFAVSEQELLKIRLRDLGLSVAGSEIEPCIDKLYAELDAKGLNLRPLVYLGDEWFSPEGVPAISVPFYLAHPRLKSLEEQIMLEVEGGTPESCLKILRHEAGHCFDHAFHVSRRPSWRKLFGSPSEEYAPEMYRPRPYSKSFVRHLDNWYAQAHPDEDFAETFAVWLAPDSNWRQVYAKWPVALKKLEMVDKLAKEFGGKNPTVAIPKNLPYDATRSQMTLETYYDRRRREHAEDYPDFYDEDLARIFARTGGTGPKAADFMRKNKKEIIDTVSFWTGERKFTVSTLVKKLVVRCEKLDLSLRASERHTILEVGSYLATLVTHYLFTGKFKRTV